MRTFSNALAFAALLLSTPAFAQAAPAATKVGKNLNTESFIKVMDTLSIPPDIFGSAPLTFSPTKRLGSDASRLSQI